MKLHTPLRSLSAYTKVTVGAAAATSAAGTADAAIVFFDVSPDKTINAGESMTFGNINLGAGTYSFGSYTNPAFMLQFTFSGATLYNGYYGSIQWGLGASFNVLNLTYGSTINPGAITNWGAAYNNLASGSNGYWVGGANAYAPLRINQGGGNYNYGWVAINYDTTGPTATISGFAFEDQLNTVILAGDQGGGPAPVPEPGTMAVGAGLFALAVGAHLRRRREKKAAAPDALLNLAAGARGVEKFRADKAA